MPWFLALMGTVGSAAGSAAGAIGSAASGLGSTAAGLGQGALSGLTSAGGAGGAAGGAGAGAGMTAAIPTGAGGIAGMSAPASFGTAGATAGMTPGLTAGSGLAGGLQSFGSTMQGIGSNLSGAAPSLSNWMARQGPIGRVANQALGGESGPPKSQAEQMIGNLIGKGLGMGTNAPQSGPPAPSGPLPQQRRGGGLSFTSQLAQKAPNLYDYNAGLEYARQRWGV